MLRDRHRDWASIRPRLIAVENRIPAGGISWRGRGFNSATADRRGERTDERSDWGDGPKASIRPRLIAVENPDCYRSRYYESERFNSATADRRGELVRVEEMLGRAVVLQFGHG